VKPLLAAVFSGFMLALAASPPRAAPNTRTPAFGELPEVQEFIAEMRIRHGFDAAPLTRQFASIRSNSAVLKAIQPTAAPELQRSWNRYSARFLNARRLTLGWFFWQKHADTLARAEAVYGVAPEIIVAIIGVETEYGRNTGKFGVLEALSTLAFGYPPRAAFFRRELEQFLLMARENETSPLDYKGSYAGAVGIPQFMPGSQRHYAVDFDGDGRVDLRHSAADAIGSVARFLNMHGWQSGAPIAMPVNVDGDAAALIAAGVKPSLSWRETRARGVVPLAADSGRCADDATVALIYLVSPDQPGEYWIGFDNFYVITRYNRSSFYAMSVFLLAESLRGAQEANASRAFAGEALGEKAEPTQQP
jgi:membrane-bound lytic murein transglycosylase B